MDAEKGGKLIQYVYHTNFNLWSRLPPMKKSMGFTEVLNKSLCRPIEQYVEVEKEFPKEFEGFYIPRCVSLFRCSSCCLDGSRECYPVVERNISLEVRRDHGNNFVLHSNEDSLRDRPQRRKNRRRRCEK
uniref:Platelet-derived growth factor (PDGF) family profile domain-containing protein n=1 Tax=Poecilia latipinna TaxID=48699 RepID=A0A3B3TNR3_9TELE